MDTPGITVQEYTALSGVVSCAVFYDGVKVPASALIGPVNGGWKVITGLLGNERVMFGGRVADTLRSLDDLLALARQDPAGAVGPVGSAPRHRLSELAVRLQACRALVMAAVRATSDGGGARLEAPMAKIVAAELAEEFGMATLELLRPCSRPLGRRGRCPGRRRLRTGPADLHQRRRRRRYQQHPALVARALGLPI